MKNKRKIELIISILVFTSIIIMLLVGFKQTDRMFNNPKFTVGIITGDYHHKTTFGTDGNDYTYWIDSKKYKGVAKSCRSKNIGDFFLVIYDSIKINRSSKLLCNYSIPDTIKAPPNGWKLEEVPIPIDMEKIKEELSW